MSAVSAEVFDRTPYQAPEANLTPAAVKTKERLFSIEGRIGVLHYNRRVAECLLAIAVGALVMFAAMSTDVKALIVGVSIPVVAVFVCAIAIMLIASIKRLHDLGRSGWFYLIGLIPVVGALWILYYSLMPGKEDDNVYGMRREATKVDKVVGIIGIVLVAIINVASLAIL